MKPLGRAGAIALALCAAAGCTDSRGRIDPLQTGLLMGGIGLAGGLTGGAIARNNQAQPYRYGGQYRGQSYYRDSGIGYAPGNYGRCNYIGGCY